MKKKFKYDSIVRFGTLQFDGHVHDYFVKNSKKLVEFYILARNGTERNFISLYQNGKLVHKHEVYSPANIFVAYPTYYCQYIYILFHYFSRNEKVYTINSLPVFFFFNSLWRNFRNFEIVYWVQDYWPQNDLSLHIFRAVMHYYHSRILKAIYVTDRINRVMNGKIVSNFHKHTVMLGTDVPLHRTYYKKTPIKLVFIGVLKAKQGIEELLAAISLDPTIQLKLIGTGDKNTVTIIKKLLKELKIIRRVYFPNKFLYSTELSKTVSDCHIGVVLYEETNNSVTYYADPAKLKQYAEFGFPIITTNTSETSHHIKKYHAGEIVHQDKNELVSAIKKIQRNYVSYTKGIQKFCEHFSYRQYFDQKFKFIKQTS